MVRKKEIENISVNDKDKSNGIDKSEIAIVFFLLFGEI